jgi:hypothetical protein
MEDLNRAPRIGQRLQQLFLEAKLSDVRVDAVQLPVGGWSPGTYIQRSLIAALTIAWYDTT